MARKVPVFGLGIGEWIAEVNNAIASRDRAISSDNAITLLVLVRSYHVESRNQRLRKSAPQYLSMPAIAVKAFDLCAIIVFSG